MSTPQQTALTSLLDGKLKGTAGHDLKGLDPHTSSRSLSPDSLGVSPQLFPLNTLALKL